MSRLICDTTGNRNVNEYAFTIAVIHGKAFIASLHDLKTHYLGTIITISNGRRGRLTLRSDLQLTGRALLQHTLLRPHPRRPWPLPALTLHRDWGQLDGAVQALIAIVFRLCDVVLAPCWFLLI